MAGPNWKRDLRDLKPFTVSELLNLPEAAPSDEVIRIRAAFAETIRIKGIELPDESIKAMKRAIGSISILDIKHMFAAVIKKCPDQKKEEIRLALRPIYEIIGVRVFPNGEIRI